MRFALAVLALACATLAHAFPTRQITIVVPFPPGGAVDLVARSVGQKMSETWGKPVVVENRTGATGIIGTEHVAKAAPDGHTLVLVPSSHAINPSMFKKLPYDTVQSFAAVALTHVVPLMLVVHPSLPAKNVPELVAHLKANPGKYAFASSGAGGAPHLSAELFLAMAGLKMTHVPYKGSTPAHADLVSGRTVLMFDTVTAINPHVKSGALRALAVTTAKRSGAVPEVPTMAEAGVAGYETSTWGGILAPAGTPKEVVATLNIEINKALAAADVRQRLGAAGIEPASGSPEDFAAFLRAEMAKWAKVAQAAGIQPE